MRIDSPVNINLTVGQDRRLPDAADGNLEVPPMILPVVLSLAVTKPSAAQGVINKTSWMGQTNVTRTNQGTTAVEISQLGLGLWELEVTLASWFNYSNVAAAFNRITLELFFPVGGGQILLTRFASPGSFTDYNRVRILIEQTAQVLIRVPATGVGESLDCSPSINAIKIL